MEVFKTVFSFFPTKGWLVVHTLQRQRVQKIMFYIEISSRNMCVRKKNTHQKKKSIPDVQSFWIFFKRSSTWTNQHTYVKHKENIEL